MKVSKRGVALGILAAGLSSGTVFADDAQVLPKGRFRARIITSYTVAKNEFNDSGETTSLGASFTRNLDAKLLGALNPATAETIRRLNAVSPGLGDEVAADVRTDVQTEIFSNVVALEYGVTDRLSVGFLLPVVHAENSVDASASAAENFSKRIEALPANDPRRAALQQVQANLNIENFDGILRDNFNYEDGFQSWSGTGLGDLELGAKYNYYRSGGLYSSVKGGVRLPTGREDDPNKLFDCGFGDGQVDLGFYHLTDYQITPAFGSTLELSYIAQLPDSASVRVPLSDELPINSQSVKVNRKLGDYWNAEIEGNYKFFKLVTLSSRYRFYQKFKDDYSSEVAVLENDTSETAHVGLFTAEYSNLSRVRSGKDKIPFAVSGFYRLPFAGSNYNDTRTVGMTLKSYF